MILLFFPDTLHNDDNKVTGENSTHSATHPIRFEV